MKDNNIFTDSLDLHTQFEIPKENRKLETRSYDYSVDYIVELIKKGNIVLEVPFQRKFVWDTAKASKLIESIIMNVPIPPIYFAEEEDGRWLVIDGLQRLSALSKYYENEFQLRGLEILKEIEKLKYKDLHSIPKARSLLDNGQLRINVIRKDSHPDIKYDVFMRLNSGAVSLNYQELRNCMNRGIFNDLCKEINKENPYFLKILGQKKIHNRFLDVEFIIRLMAIDESIEKNELSEYYVKNYPNNMVSFLNNYMQTKKSITANEAILLKEKFYTKIEQIVDIFGIEETFKDPFSDKKKVNKALAECIYSGTEFYRKLSPEIVKKSLKDLLSNNQDFKNAISQKTTDKSILNFRINTWLTILNNLPKI